MIKADGAYPGGEEPTPYRVWVSEIMLQQTRVEAVKPYFARFMERLPDIEALAEVDDDELLKLWGRTRLLQQGTEFKGCGTADCDRIRRRDAVGLQGAFKAKRNRKLHSWRGFFDCL